MDQVLTIIYRFVSLSALAVYSKWFIHLQNGSKKSESRTTLSIGNCLLGFQFLCELLFITIQPNAKDVNKTTLSFPLKPPFAEFFLCYTIPPERCAMKTVKRGNAMATFRSLLILLLSRSCSLYLFFFSPSFFFLTRICIEGWETRDNILLGDVHTLAI